MRAFGGIDGLAVAPNNQIQTFFVLDGPATRSEWLRHGWGRPLGPLPDPHRQDVEPKAIAGLRLAIRQVMGSDENSGTVLVVEDPFVRSLLERRGYRVWEADIATGLSILSSGEHDIRILITNNPSAFAEVARTIPLVYMAAFPVEALAAPFQHWRALRKPFKPDQLLRAIQELLNEMPPRDAAPSG